MKRRILLVLLLGTLGLQAQHPRNVTLEEAVASALEHNASLRAGAARVEAADARSSEAGALLLPQVRLTGRVAHVSDVPEFTVPIPGVGTLFPSIQNQYAARLTVQQPVFLGFRLTKSKDMADLQAEATRQDFQRDRADLVFNVTLTYWNLSRVIAAEKVVDRAVQQVEEHVRNVEAFVQRGMATELDLLKAQTQLSEVRVKRIEARSGIRIVMMNLNALLGNPLDTELHPVPVGDVLPGDTDGGDLSLVVSRALEHRPELKAGRYRRDMSEAGVAVARSGWWPQVQFAANYDYARPNQRIIPLKDQFEGTWDVGVNFQWNVWDWLTVSKQTAQAEASQRQAESMLELTSNAIAVETAQSYFRTGEAAEKVQVARAGVGQALEAQRITSAKFKQGLSSTTDVLDADVALMRAELTLTDATVDLMVQRAALRRAMGEVGEESP